MKVIIIDDEKIAIDVLRIILQQLTEFEISIQGAFTNVIDALALLEKETINLVFLDIEMIDTHGLQVAKQLLVKQPSLQIIFVTAHTQFAVDAFDIEATDYLLKPVHEKRLIKALTKAQQKWQLRQPHTTPEKHTSLLYAHTFGSFYLLNAQKEIVKWRTKKARELFLYLWFHHKKPMLNAILIEELWSTLDFEKAANHLHTTIYQLRKLLKENGGKDPIQLVNNHYQLNIEIDSDYDELIQLIEREKHDEQSIQQLLNCYEGDFLAEEEYSWAISIQFHLKQMVLHILETFVQKTAAINPLLQLNCLQKMLEMDEFNEHYMFLLLEFLIKQNKKQDCIRYYKHIQEKLAEINVPIPKKIQQIYNDYMVYSK
ncbi:response regulator [Lysinibacillus sp. FSL K6-0232]|uniref:response regulator n=1 Tax=unclassified Lysinibacillus TaxID=2636778 RepID=UPI0030FAE0A4